MESPSLLPLNSPALKSEWAKLHLVVKSSIWGQFWEYQGQNLALKLVGPHGGQGAYVSAPRPRVQSSAAAACLSAGSCSSPSLSSSNLQWSLENGMGGGVLGPVYRKSVH